MSDRTEPSEDPRLAQIIELLTELAAGRLDARLPIPQGDDQLDIIIGGLNMFAEELAANIMQEREVRITLEERVKQRTAELTGKLATIEAQRQIILALSAPVLQVWDGILLMPVIGEIDSHHAEIMEANLLEAVAARGAAVAIVDLTAIARVDTQVAHHLSDLVAAARLLGTHVILTGLSPDNAQTLTRLGIAMQDWDCQGTLQAGLKRAVLLNETR